MSENKTPIDKAFDQFAEECSEVKIIRKSMIDKLRKQIDIIQIDTERDQARSIEVKMQVFATLDNLLKSVESSSERNVKLNMARKDSENNGQIASSIAELIKSISGTCGISDTQKQPINTDSITEAIEAKANKLGIEVSEGEITECGAKPSGDVSRPKDEIKEEN